MARNDTPKNGKRFGLRLNKWTLRMTRNWMRIVLTIIGIYATLPFAAPALMHVGLTRPANILYTMYSPFCHQFAFRSVFLFGPQTAYPREVTRTELDNFEPYALESPDYIESYKYWYQYFTAQEATSVTEADLIPFSPWVQFAARDFRGNEEMGYKTALCQRDVAIYLAIFVGGLIYSRFRWRLRPAPWWLYILLGLMPIGIDGFSQMLGYPPFELWPVRETLPHFRILTGTLFGLMTAWLGFPYLERSMWETRQQLEAKFARLGIDPEEM